MRPQARVVGLTLEGADPLDVRRSGRREIARGHDYIGGADGLAGIGLYRPATRRLIEDGGCNDRVELDVLANVEAVGHMLHVREDLALVAVALGPLPFLVELRRE